MNFDNIPSDKIDSIVTAGIELMTAITDAFGPEEGHKIWDDLSNQFGSEVKHSIFLALLSGQTSGEVTVTVCGPRLRQTNNFVEVIKCIRNYTGLGLKEAKDVCDKLDSGIYASLKVSARKKANFLQDLHKFGGKC